MKNKKNLTTIRVLFFGVFSIVILAAIYLTINSSLISLSPQEGFLSYENAAVSISELGPDGIRWYCGFSDNFTDKNGNQYGSKELEELRKVLGNDMKLYKEFCE